jgi:hypothetical protein
MYSLLCTPIITIPQNVITVEKCRMVNVEPTGDKNAYVITMLDAPVINVLPPQYTIGEIDKNNMSIHKQ